MSLVDNDQGGIFLGAIPRRTLCALLFHEVYSTPKEKFTALNRPRWGDHVAKRDSSVSESDDE